MSRWIFAYGSLIWRPDFPFLESQPALAPGFSRRFWQGSTDHRGVPGKPGRVVTLARTPGNHCSGVAYRLARAQEDEVLTALDHREKGGYTRHDLEVELSGAGPVKALTWLAKPDNPNYLGPAEEEIIARQVLDAIGPSGANTEYVLRLQAALTRAGVPDPHVDDIAEWMQRLSPQFTNNQAGS